MSSPTLADTRISCPYPGLRPFRSHEAPLFFGRGAQVEELLARLESRRFLAVVGSSGCGKSSLVRAGLIPALQEGFLSGAQGPWRIARMRPGNAPFAQLARALLAEEALEPERASLPGAMGLLQATLRRGPGGLLEALTECGVGSRDPVLLLVDQFEEIFRYRRESDINEADAFVNLLLASGRPGPVPLYVVLTMRSDFIGDCALFLGLPETINDGQFLVPRLTREQYRAAIVEPARLAGTSLTAALVNRLLNDLKGDPDQLPVLQHALMRMWNRHADAARPLDIPDYEAVGGLEQALARHADQLLGELDEHQRAIARRLFRCLAERGEDQRDTRRPARLGEVAASAGVAVAAVAAVVEVFRGAGRSFLMPPPPEPLGEDSVVDISHEALIRRWRTLNRWVNEEAEAADTYRRLADAAQRHARGEAALWRTPDLQLALDWRAREQPSAAWAARYGGDHGAALAFLEASERAWAREQRERLAAERRHARQRRWVIIGLSALLLIAALSSLWGWWSYGRAIQAAEEAQRQRQRAEMQREEAEIQRSLVLSHQLHTQAQQLRERDSTLGLLLGVEAVRVVESAQHPQIRPVEEGLRATLALPGQARLGSHKGRVASLAFSARHGLLASAGDDGSVRLWDIKDPGAEPRILRNHEKWVNAVVFSPLSGILASGGDDGTVRLWDPATPDTPPRILGRHEGWVWSLAFAPDSNRLASGGADGVIRLWEPARPELAPLSLDGHQGGVLALVASPDGRWLASAGADGAVRLWSLIDPAAPSRLLLDREGWIWSLAFSQAGDLAAGDEAGIIRLWTADGLDDDPAPRVLGSHDDKVYALAFTADGQLASAGEGGGLRLWSTPAPATSTLLHEGDSPLWSLAFVDDARLASGTADGMIRLWRLTAPVREPRVLAAHQDGVNSVAVSRHWLASGSQDGTVRLWRRDALDAPPLVIGNPRDDWINAVAVSADQRWLAAGDTGNRIRLWRLDDLAAEPRRLEGHTDWINVLDFSPDGELLASASADGTARLWPVDDPQAPPRVIRVAEPAWINAVAFSPDGAWLATGDTEHAVKLWSLDDLDAPARMLRGHGDWVNTVAFSPDGSLLASGSSDNTVRLWPLADPGLEPLLLRGHSGWVDSVAFSPDGELLASAGSDDTVYLWRLASDNPRPVALRGHGDWVTAVTFTPDGEQLVTASDDASVRLWRVRLDDLLAAACRQAGRNLRWAEWQWYLGEVPYRRTCPDQPLPDSVAAALLETGDALAARGAREEAVATYQRLLALGYVGELDPPARARAMAARSPSSD